MTPQAEDGSGAARPCASLILISLDEAIEPLGAYLVLSSVLLLLLAGCCKCVEVVTESHSGVSGLMSAVNRT